jgi:hypothetical protein
MAATVERTDEDILAEARDLVRRLSGPEPQGVLLWLGVDHGRLSVSGNVPTADMAASIRKALEAIPGVTDLSDEIVDDDQLQATVQATLDSDVERERPRHKVHVVMGTVYIDWSGRDALREQHVRDRLLMLPGVRAVVHGNWSSERRMS